MNPFTFLLTLSATAVLATHAAAVQINWGSEVDSVFRDSLGNPLDETFAIQLGFFESVLGVPFTPDETNTSEWAANWRVFDQAVYYPESGYFTSAASLRDDGSSSSPFADLGINFANQDAFIWIHNSTTPGVSTEWFLARSSSSTGTTWRLPEEHIDACCDTAILEWSMSDLIASDTPVIGRQKGEIGGGTYKLTDSYEVQTFTVVPEPATALLALLGAATAALRRRRA